MNMDIALISHSTAAAAFLVLTVLLLVSWQRGAIGAILLAACAMTTLWAMVSAYDAWRGGTLHTLVGILEVLRTAGWLCFLLSLLFLNRSSQKFPSAWLMAPPAIAVICLAVISVDLLRGTGESVKLPGINLDFALFGRFMLAVGGLLFMENLLRNTRSDRRWGIKYLCLGIGGLFAYDFFMFADALLFDRVNPDLLAARGITGAVVVPLIAVAARRNPAWSLDIFVSRQVVFHSASLLGAGVYLLAMAGAGLYLREVGGEWGFVVQSIFLFAAVLLLLLVVSSGSFRATIKRFIATHFFSYKYDYRDEWLRFIATISETRSGGSLPLRVIQGIADIVESPEGAIWLNQGDYRFTPLESWNCDVPPDDQTVDPSFAEALEHRQAVLNLDGAGNGDRRTPSVVFPEWLHSVRRPSLIIPMLHNDRLLGFLLLGEPRIRVEIEVEDYALLKTVAKQAASYLAEQQSANALADSRRFEDFNRRFAFVLHDIKNLVSQLSLIVQNADRHRNNPAFQEDMLRTVKESADKMNRLLVRLHKGGKDVSATAIVELAPILHQIVARSAGRAGNISLQCDHENVAVVADETRLSAVIAHIVENSLDAVGENGSVWIGLRARGGEAVVEVKDDGPGMDAQFMRDELFRPFRTTKHGGFGIGAFESREFVHELGGRMDVSSQPGKGTTVRISLPATTAGETPGKKLHEVGAL